MAVATGKRTQTNFGVNAVWQFLTWRNVERDVTGSAEMRSFVTGGFCLMVTSLLSLL